MLKEPKDMAMLSVRLLVAAILAMGPSPALARNILLTDDDGLTSNVKALYDALKAQGHDVIVSVPCSNQSGMGASVHFHRVLEPVAADCRNGAAPKGGPGAGPMKRADLPRDFFYVDGTPVMALLYGLDVVSSARWGKAPDLVLSGPNEGQNVGMVVLTSGTVSNAQVAIGRGIPAIALSAGGDTIGDAALANPKSLPIARLSAELVSTLDKRAGNQPILPPGVALNVNFPDRPEGARWKLSRIGTYSDLRPAFVQDLSKTERGRQTPERKGPAVVAERNTAKPTAAQMNDESVVFRKDISVSVMQFGYDASPAQRAVVARRLRGFAGN